MAWESVIGLEVHVQLKTKSKIFSGSSTEFGADPNTQACAIDLGLPGVLPVLNEEVVKMAVKFGLAINATIASNSVFERKNYFYPDLPKGYQITQNHLPIVTNGTLSINLEDGTTKEIGIRQAHLEEDAGKSLHEDFHGQTGVDLNRAGTPLVEIVSKPDLRTAAQAVAYLKTLHSLLRYIDISDVKMQEGSFRCDANISVRKKGEKEFGTRTEVKNVNSFRFVEKAINYEINRQIQLIESGKQVIQETRLYDSAKDETRPMRTKEEAMDYRYFPDPDLLPVQIDEAFINDVKATLPELPKEKCERFIKDYKLSDYDANVLTASKDLANYFEIAVKASNNNIKITANWVMGELLANINKESIELSESPITAKQLGKLVLRICDNTISGKIAKSIFEEMWNNNAKQNNKTEIDVDDIIEQKGLKQITDSSAIEKIIDEVIANNPNQVEQYRSGKDKLFGFFVGQVMKQSQGKANPAQVNELLKKKLIF